jgi:hypothetical protein
MAPAQVPRPTHRKALLRPKPCKAWIDADHRQVAHGVCDLPVGWPRSAHMAVRLRIEPNSSTSLAYGSNRMIALVFPHRKARPRVYGNTILAQVFKRVPAPVSAAVGIRPHAPRLPTGATSSRRGMARFNGKGHTTVPGP